MAQFFLHFNIANFVEPVIFGTTEDGTHGRCPPASGPLPLWISGGLSQGCYEGFSEDVMAFSEGCYEVEKVL